MSDLPISPAESVDPAATPASPAPTDARPDTDPADTSAPADEAADAAEGEEPSGEKPAKRGAERRIAELTARLRAQERVNESVMQQVARLRQLVPEGALAEAQTTEEYDLLQQRRATADTVAQMRQMELEQGQQAYRKELNNLFAARVEAVRDSLPDLEQVYAQAELSELGMAFCAMSDKGPEIAYWLGKNPTLASRIASLNPVDQGIALARLEAKVERPTARTSATPPPPRTVGQGRATPPRNPSEMSMEEFAKYRSAGGGTRR